MNNTLFLNFFADSEKWENLVLCPAYPIGMSYYRAFRYRDNWIYDFLLDKIKNGSFEYKSAIIGASFLGKERINQLLPIRKIENIHLEKSWDNRYYFYFTFGKMVDFSSFENLEDLVITLPEYDQIENRTDPYLLIHSQANLDKIIFTDGSEKKELNSWAKYADLISHDEGLPINNKAKQL